jgi:hypothetical protein
VGTNAITAVYSGGSSFASSTSSVFSQVIMPGTNTDITSGLVLDYPLSANGNDIVRGNNLTLVGSPTFSGGAINWNGAIPTLGYSASQQWPQTGMTVSAWINMSDPNASYSVVSCYGDGGGSINTAYLQFYTYFGKLGARVIQNTDANYIGRYTPPLLTAGWHFVVATWSGGMAGTAIAIYMDGTQIDNADNSAGTFTGPYAGSGVPLIVGVQGSVGSGIFAKFTGSERDVRIYNRPLALSEIATLYANGLQGGLKSATTVVTTSGNPVLSGNAVTLTAMVSGNGGIPTGSVLFYDENGSGSLGTGTLNGAGVATLTTSALPPGIHAITAIYGGDANFSDSIASVFTQIIINAADVPDLLWYSMTNNEYGGWTQGTTTFIDNSTSGGLTGYFYQPSIRSWRPDPFGGMNAAHWSGDQTLLTVSNSASRVSFTNQDRTFSFWVFPQTYNWPIMGNVDPLLQNGFIFTCSSAGAFGVATFNYGVYSGASETIPSLLSLTWIHVEVTFQGGTNVSVYINGKLDKNLAPFTINPMGPTLQDFQVGYPAGPDIDGNIYSIKIWSYVRTPAQIGTDQ